MLLLLIASSLLAFVAVVLAVLQLAPEHTADDADEQRMPQLYRLFRPLIKYAAGLIRHIPLGWMRDQYRRRIDRAGLAFDMSADDFLAIKVLVSAAMFAFALLMFYSNIARDPLTLIAGFALGFLWPDARIGDVINKRERSIQKALPDFLDLLVLAVESGLDFVGAARKVADRFQPGPLTWEFRGLLRSLSMGKSRNEALREMGTRLAIQDVTIFVNSVVQATEAGAGIGLVLRTQAAEMRSRRFQRAEKLAYEAPVKMLLPLIAFIFPAVFIIVLGPVILNVFLSGALEGLF
jgi:tight adherence protein C